METEQRGAGGNLVRVRPPGERSSLSRSATRALDILELFGQVQNPLRAIDIAHALRLGPSTTNQLLKTMVESAHLTFEAASKTYLPSPRLARFGIWMVANYGASAQLQTLLASVQKTSGETVTLTTPNDIFMQIIDLTGTQDNMASAVRGLRVSIFGSAIGTAYLATLTDPEITRLADRARVPISNLPGVFKDINRVRQDGVADGPNQGSEMWSIAAPLRRQTAPAPLVLGLAGPTSRIQHRLGALRALIRNAAALPEA